MSVQRDDYIIVGVDLSNIVAQRNDDDWDKICDAHTVINDTDLYYLQDYMGGKYFIVGRVLAEASQYDGFGFYDIDMEHIKPIAQRVREQIIDEFGVDTEPRVMVVSNWY